MTGSKADSQKYYKLVNPKWIQATIHSAESQPATRCSAELREISPLGAKLLVRDLGQVQCGCRISLASPELLGALKVLAKVHCVRPHPAGDCLMDCEFDPPLSDGSFQWLLESGNLERRSAPRKEVHIPVQLQWEPGTPRVPALVCNISEGGLCLATSGAPEHTSNANILASSSGSEIQITLKICFVRNVGADYFIGCQFIQQADFAVLQKLHRIECDLFQPVA